MTVHIPGAEPGACTVPCTVSVPAGSVGPVEAVKGTTRITDSISSGSGDREVEIKMKHTNTWAVITTISGIGGMLAGGIWMLYGAANSGGDTCGAFGCVDNGTDTSDIEYGGIVAGVGLITTIFGGVFWSDGDNRIVNVGRDHRAPIRFAGAGVVPVLSRWSDGTAKATGAIGTLTFGF